MGRNQATFISPVQPAPNVALVDDHARMASTSSVKAQVAQNLCAGIGVASVLVAVWLSLHGAAFATGFVADAWPNGGRVTITATLAGLGAFGALMFVRNAIDEWVESLDWHHAMSDLDAGDTRIAELEQLLDAAERRADVAETQQRVQAMNMAANQRRRVDPVPERAQVLRDAEWLIARRFDTGDWTRDGIVKKAGVGWNEKRWDTTMDHLIRAGLVRKNGKKNEPVYDTALTMLEGLHEYEDSKNEAFRRVGSSPDDPTHVVGDDSPDDRGRGGGAR